MARERCIYIFARWVDLLRKNVNVVLLIIKASPIDSPMHINWFIEKNPAELCHRRLEILISARVMVREGCIYILGRWVNFWGKISRSYFWPSNRLQLILWCISIDSARKLMLNGIMHCTKRWFLPWESCIYMFGRSIDFEEKSQCRQMCTSKYAVFVHRSTFLRHLCKSFRR